MSDENEKTTDEKEIKVTDKRMFTPDGELREEYRGRIEPSEGEQAASTAPTSPRPSPGGPTSDILGPEAGVPSGEAPPKAEPGAEPGGRPSPGAGAAPAAPGASAPQTPRSPRDGGPGPSPAAEKAGEKDADGESEYPSGAQFEDLIGLLAQGASVYLQQARRPERRSEHLELARLHVDLLAILKKKTEGNLSTSEKALLDDALYQLRMAVVQHG